MHFSLFIKDNFSEQSIILSLVNKVFVAYFLLFVNNAWLNQLLNSYEENLNSIYWQ